MDIERQIFNEIAEHCPSAPIVLASCGHYVSVVKGEEYHFPPSGGLSVKCEASHV